MKCLTSEAEETLEIMLKKKAKVNEKMCGRKREGERQRWMEGERDTMMEKGR